MKATEYKPGDQYRNWTIKGEAPRSKTNDQRRVVVECRCGNVCERTLSQITNGKSNNCNKCQKDRTYTLRDLKKKYGELTVVCQRPGRKDQPNIFTRCSCNNEQWQRLTLLESGNSTTCGHCGKDPRKQRKKQDMGNDGLGKVVQPKSEANDMRQSKKCFTDGTCVNYSMCGNRLFTGKCHGKEVKVETRQTW